MKMNFKHHWKRIMFRADPRSCLMLPTIYSKYETD